MKNYLFILLFLFPLTSLAEDFFLKKIDDLYQSREINEEKYNSLFKEKYGYSLPRDSAENEKVSLDDLDFSNIPAVNSYEDAQEIFEYMRDYDGFIQNVQFIADGNYPFPGDWYVSSPEDPNSFPRRLSWLAMQTGCETRATLGGKIINDRFNLKLKKLFVFGRLSADAGQFAPNPDDDIVRWNMHNAVIVKVTNEDQVYVLDPSINADSPILLENWYTQINYDDVNQDTFTGSICNLETLSQSYDCNSKDASSYDEALERLEGVEDGYTGYLYEEWRSVQVRKNDPYKVLGDSPPWE